jgi:hypothetical protein
VLVFFIAFPLFEKDWTGVGAVDAHVTQGASLALGVLRVRRVIEVLVTLETESVHARSRQQPRICGTVGRVTRRTTFGPDGFMLENERAALFSVALVADGILRGIHAKLLGQHCSVNVMAILALDVAIQYTMPKRFHEISFRLGVAGEAKVGISFDQQLLFDLGYVSGVTRGTRDTVLVMNRAIEVLVLEIVFVARHATLGDLFRFLIGEAEDLGLIASTVNVR